MIVTVFRSRLMPDVEDQYLPMARRMTELATAMPGYISHKIFVAEDGERLTLVEFESEDAQHAWKMHPEHAQAQRHGRQNFYADYRLQICHVIRDTTFTRERKA
jgi:heme-degrading monooxygenase HmoA